VDWVGEGEGRGGEDVRQVSRGGGGGGLYGLWSIPYSLLEILKR
jgi:hypothetical protein